MLKNSYVSEIDQCLRQFDQTHCEKSISQQKEIAKYAHIAQLRDEIATLEPFEEKKLWKGF